MRSHIVSGRYGPGQRLPTYTELEVEFDAGRATIQHALATLKRDGFVESVDRQGMYVSKTPPHLHQYGIAMASSPGESGWTQLMVAVTNEARRIEQNDPHKRFKFYYGVQDVENLLSVVNRLRDDILSCRLGGLVLTPKTYSLYSHPDLAGLEIPRVCLWSRFSEGGPPCISADQCQLIRRALRFLKEKGRRRVAILHMADTTYWMNHKELYDEAGLEYHPPWVQHIGRSHPELAAEVLSLLMDYRADVRPDGLIIADDTLLVPVSHGIIDAGLKAGEDFDIVAHGNWPWEAIGVLPMTRIGFDVRQVIRWAMEVLAMQRKGLMPPKFQVVPAMFESELQPNNGDLADALAERRLMSSQP